MFGKNPIRKPVTSNGLELDVQEIFPTIQGEGIYSGTPSVFIRLGGCNLACSFCDTEFESFSKIVLEDILKEIENLSLNTKKDRVRKLVVITGGEPFRQPIEELCKKLIEKRFIVQIETNGTIYRNLDSAVKIVCSPKNTGNGYARIREDLLKRVNAVKFIISEDEENYRNVSEVGQADYNIPVYVQPMDAHDKEKTQKNIARAKALAEEDGYILSLQLHKVLKIK